MREILERPYPITWANSYNVINLSNDPFTLCSDSIPFFLGRHP